MKSAIGWFTGGGVIYGATESSTISNVIAGWWWIPGAAITALVATVAARWIT